MAVVRRQFISVLSGAVAVWPLAGRAQKLAGRTARIGVLRGSPDSQVIFAYPAFLDELKKYGFREGQNLTIEAVRVEREPQPFVETADLVRSNAIGPEIVLQAAIAASPTLPIVMWAINFDPIAHGYANSLARPGGNITGVVTLQRKLAEKQVELLTKVLPGRTRLAILWDAISEDHFAAAERQARALRLDVQSVKLENPPYDFDATFRSLADGASQMLLVLSSPFFGQSGPHIAELAAYYVYL